MTTTTTEPVIDLTGIRLPRPGLEVGDWVYLITRSGNAYGGELRDRDADGLTLGPLNSDAETARHGGYIEAATVFVPWAAITSVLTGAEGETTDPDAGTYDSRFIEYWLEQHSPRSRAAVPGTGEDVTVLMRDGETVIGEVQGTDEAGVRIGLDSDTTRGQNHYRRVIFVPWTNVREMQWAEFDPWATNRANRDRD